MQQQPLPCLIMTLMDRFIISIDCLETCVSTEIYNKFIIVANVLNTHLNSESKKDG